METVISIFKSAALKFPNKQALGFNDQLLTFSELDRITDHLAVRLQNAGIKGNDRVCIMLQRNIALVAAILGVMKSGAAYVPVDMDQGHERIKMILQDAGAKALVISRSDHKQLNIHYEGAVIYEDELIAYCTKNKPAEPPAMIDPAHLAYVIYTSGTTGKPKGVMVSHEALLTHVFAFHQLCPVTSADSCLLTASVSFDVSVYEIFTSIIWGATLHVLRKNIITDIPALMQIILDRRISSLFLPPLVIEAFAGYVENNNIMLPLKRLLVGVEPIRQHVLESVRKKMPEGMIINGYGPTEATVCATALHFIGVDSEREIVSIGKPLPGYKVLLLDEQLQPVSQGVPGQIVIAGKGLAKGYLNDPKLTDVKFSSGIEKENPAERYYLTGDLAVMLPNGNIEFIGRSDSQVKVRGYRIETGEVDAAFLAHPDIIKVATVIVQKPNRQNELVTFYTADNQVSGLTEHVAARLPVYMIPHFIEYVNQFPLTISGKTDLKALRNQFLAKQKTEKASQASTKDEILESLFRRNLSTGPFDKESSYFQLGGDSIGAMVLIIDVQEKFGVHVSSRWFYENASFNALYQKILSAEDEQPQSFIDQPADQANEDQSAAYPLTQAQQTLYFLHQLDKSHVIYNIFLQIDITGNLCIDVLRDVLDEILEEHQLMRSAVKLREGKLLIEPLEHVEWDLPVIHADDSKDDQDTLYELKRKWSRHVFKLDEAPLWRFHLVAKGPTHHVLFFTVHHLIFDGWSAGVFMNAIQQKYAARLQHAEQMHPPAVKDLSFRNFVRWHDHQMAAQAWEQDFLYWQQKLKDLPSPFFDLQHNKPGLSNGKRYTWSVSSSLMVKAKHFAKEHNTTLFAVLFAPYFLTLFNSSGKWDGQIATLHANRIRSPFDKMIGYMTNVLVIRACVEERLSLADFVMQVTESCKDAFKYCMYPFDGILKRMDVRVTHEDNPVFQCFFILQNWMETLLNSDFQDNPANKKHNFNPDADNDDAACTSVNDEVSSTQPIQIAYKELGSHSAKAVLSMNCVAKQDSMECWIEYPVNIFDTREIVLMANAYNLYLNVILDKPDLKVADLVGQGILRKAMEPQRVVHEGFPEWPFDIPAKGQWAVSGSESIKMRDVSCLWAHGKLFPERLLSLIGLFVSKTLQTETFILPVYVPSGQKQAEQELVTVSFAFDYDQSLEAQWERLNVSVAAQIEGCLENIKLNAGDKKNHAGKYTVSDGQNSPVVISFCGEQLFRDHAAAIVFAVDTFAHTVKIYGVDHPGCCFFNGPVLAEHFEPLLNGALANPRPLKHLHLLLPAQVDQLSGKCNAASRALHAESVNVLVHFKENLQQYPDAPAIVDQSRVVSYVELDRLSTLIAGALLKKTLPKGLPVGIMLDRSPIMIASVLAIFKAGMPYLPLDANLPGARLKTILDDAKPLCILTNKTDHDAFNGRHELIINPETLAVGDQHDPPSFVPKPSDAAYIIYTSGSTGVPKGVVVPHLALSSFIRAAIQRYGIKHTDRIMQFASFTFDAAVEEIFCALCTGACLVLRNDNMLSSMRVFIDEVSRHEVTVLDLPTAFWSQMVHTLTEEKRSFPPGIRLVIIGGEKAPSATTALWAKHFPDKPLLINTYGPTEATVVATSCYLHESHAEGAFSIGAAFGDTLAVVTDKYLNPLPPGITGELALAGPQLASGYLHDAVATNLKFVKPDQSLFKGLRFFRTGDKAFLNSQQQLMFQGRIDKQVKIRGFRVELSEIDVFLLQNPEVREAYTIFRKHHGSPRIISYVVVQDTDTIDISTITEHLKNSLPDYMLPAAVVPLDRFPLTGNMKIDEKALPDPIFDDLSADAPEILSKEQEVVAEVFRKTLNIKHCRSDSNFFDHGGDSLLALLCISELENRTGISLSIGAFYENPLVSRLAALIEEHNDTKQFVGSLLPKEIVCLKKGGDAKPLIFTVFFDAANHHLPMLVEQGQGVYTFIPQGSDGEKITRKSVQQMAAFYVDILEKNFRKQAVKLAGYSFGGLVALEMAIMLQAKHWKIEKLLLVDTMAPKEWKRKAVPVRNIREKWKIIKNMFVSSLMSMLDKPVPRRRRNLYILYHWHVAARSYVPLNAGLNEAIVLIRSSRSLSELPLLGWECEEGFKVDKHVIEGDHHSLVRSREGVKKILELSGLAD